MLLKKIPIISVFRRFWISNEWNLIANLWIGFLVIIYPFLSVKNRFGIVNIEYFDSNLKKQDNSHPLINQHYEIEFITN